MSGVIERASLCDPKLCALAERPHAHCSCGLPMEPDAEVCQLCMREQLDPDELLRRRGVEEPAAWDGLSYPSRRRRRITSRDPERHRELIAAVLQPELGSLHIEVARGRDRSCGSARTVGDVPSPAALRVAGEAGERVLGSGGR
jgi:hypothetical protein